MNAREQPAAPGPIEPAVAQIAMADGWYWVRFETMDAERTEPQPALWNGRHWHGVGWKGIPLDGAVVLGPCQMPGKPVAWQVQGPLLSGPSGGAIWHRAPHERDWQAWRELGIADRVTVIALCPVDVTGQGDSAGFHDAR